MFVTEEEAATIYAKACRSWYGARAGSVVHSQVRKLMAKGDGKEGLAASRACARKLKRRGIRGCRGHPSLDQANVEIALHRANTRLMVAFWFAR